MGKLYLPIGMIGSGKSTWSRQFIKTDSKTKIVSGDNIRFMLHGGEYFYHSTLEPAVIDILMQSTETLLLHGYDVILDEGYCSLTRKMRQRVASFALFHNVVCVAVVFPERNLEDRIEDKVTKGLRGKTVTYWKRVFREMVEIYEPFDMVAEDFSEIMLIGAEK